MKRQDMLKSKVFRSILSFATPLLVGNLLQQLYNTVDAVVVGRFVGKNALAAVGAAMPLYTVLSFFIIGATVGVGVYLANLYGAGDKASFKIETSTALITGLVMTVAVALLLLVACKPILRLMQTPDEIIADANGYLLILVGGLVFTFIYNFYTAGLRAVGNSFMPFLVLMFSAVLNTGLDFLFVVGFRMGVIGAGIATILAQLAAAVLIVILAYKSEPLLALKRKEFVFKKEYFKKTVSYGAVTAVQQTFISLGRLFVQAAVNPLGTDTIAGYNAGTRIESFIAAPFDALSVSISTFSAQNLGAKQGTRIWKAIVITLAMTIAYAAAVLLLLFTVSGSIMTVFVDGSETAVIDAGAIYLKSMAFYYFGAAFTYILQGVHRGMGNLKIVFLATVIQIGIRVALTYILTPAYGIPGVAFAIFAGWVVMTVFDFAFFYKIRRIIGKNRAFPELDNLEERNSALNAGTSGAPALAAKTEVESEKTSDVLSK